MRLSGLFSQTDINFAATSTFFVKWRAVFPPVDWSGVRKGGGVKIIIMTRKKGRQTVIFCKHIDSIRFEKKRENLANEKKKKC